MLIYTRHLSFFCLFKYRSAPIHIYLCIYLSTYTYPHLPIYTYLSTYTYPHLPIYTFSINFFLLEASLSFQKGFHDEFPHPKINNFFSSRKKSTVRIKYNPSHLHDATRDWSRHDCTVITSDWHWSAMKTAVVGSICLHVFLAMIKILIISTVGILCAKYPVKVRYKSHSHSSSNSYSITH